MAGLLVVFTVLVFLAALIIRMMRSQRPDGKMLFFEKLIDAISDEQESRRP